MKKMIFAIAAMIAATLSAFQVVQPTVGADGRLTAQAGGKLVRVIAVSPTVATGTVNLEAVYSTALFTNAVDIATTTGTTYRVAWSNQVSHAVFTNEYATLPIPVQIYCAQLSIATNTTVTAITNTWPVYERTAYVTNAIVTGGTASGGIYSAAPASDTYLSGTDTLYFSGTATSNGFLRLVFE